MAVSLLIACLGLLSLVPPLASPLSSDTVLNAAEILSDSGRVSMSLTLSLFSQTLTLTSPPTLSVFAPPDAAFRLSGQPALSLLHYHFCPLHLPLRTLRSLPSGTTLPTLSPGRLLVVTSSPFDPQFSLNNVTVATGSSPPSPIFDDGSLIVFGIEDFLNPDFQSRPRNCGSSETAGFPGASRFREASESLQSSGHSAAASFLGSQLLGFDEEQVPAMTVFAPPDQAVEGSAASAFLRHVVPCRLLQSDLESLNDGTVLATYSDGFTIAVTRSDSALMLNGVAVVQAEVYRSDFLAVHGLGDVLAANETAQEAPGPESDARSDRRRIEDVMLTENIEF